MKQTIVQWLILSTCILLIYNRAYGRRGIWAAILFLLCIGFFLWLLNRGDRDKR